MARSRVSLSGQLVLGLVAAATTWVALLSWRGFTVDARHFVQPLLVLGLVVAGVGAVTRWWRLPRVVVFGAQALVSAMVASTYLVRSPIPVGGRWTELTDVVRAAVDTSNGYAAPVPAEAPPVYPLLILGGLACLLLVDLLACTLRRVPLAGLPLLSIYSVPVSLLGTDLSWWVFAGTAAGFLGLLFLHEREHVSRWGRALADETGAGAGVTGLRTGTARTNAIAIGGVVTALAVVVPMAIPTLSWHVFDFGAGNGGGDQIHIENPMADLQRDLNRGQDVPLVRITTDDPDPSYLRIAVLNRFSNEKWSSGDRKVPSANRADGPVPEPVGVAADVPRAEYPYELSATDDFDSRWLPTPQNISDIFAEDDWRYDPSTMDFIAGDDDLDTRGKSWSLTGVKLNLAAVDLVDAAASPGSVSSEYTALPPGIDPLVRELALGVTKDAGTKFQKAVALQNWFRVDGGFTYDTRVNLGTGEDDLVRFLAVGPDGRTGYCEQFAASMAVMARQLGIPARLAVGFLRPERVAKGVYEYSAHDLHAWPELYFAGAGWVRFEPTPAGRAVSTPSYTQTDVSVGDPAAPPSSSTAAPSGPAVEPTRKPLPETPDTSATPDAESDDGIAWVPVAGGVGGLALLALLLLTPRLVRTARRRGRLEGGAEDAWVELRDTVVDLGLTWPRYRSPRQTRDVLVRHFGSTVDRFDERPVRGPEVAPDAVRALDRLVGTLERQRYSSDPTRVSGTFQAEIQTCVDALSAGVTPRTRRRARWWPRSVFVRTPRTAPANPDDTGTTSPGGVVEHVGG